MSYIDPSEPGAIPNYLWVKAQDGIRATLQEVSDNQSALNSSYKFEVKTNLWRPVLEDDDNAKLANILIGRVREENKTARLKNHVVEYYVDCHVRSADESGIPADERAVEWLQYLTAMVEFGLSWLERYYKSLGSGQIAPRSLTLEYDVVDGADEATQVYAPARFIYTCAFPYSAQDFVNLPDLEKTRVTLDNFATEITY